MRGSGSIDSTDSGRKVVSFTSRPLTSEGKPPMYVLTGKLGGVRRRSDYLEKRKIPFHSQESKAGSTVAHSTAQPLM